MMDAKRMTNEQAARILDPATRREALAPYAQDGQMRLAVTEEACRVPVEMPYKTAWINVKDRLPDQDGWYLVYAPGYRGNSRIYGLDGMAYSNFKDNYKNHWGIERGGSRGWPGIVTHWMPLPEPPPEEQDG